MVNNLPYNQLKNICLVILNVLYVEKVYPSSENLNVKTVFSGHRLNLNIIINAINLYYSLSNLTPTQVCGINYTHQEKVN